MPKRGFMCIALPGMVERVDLPGVIPRMADVDFGGVKKQVCIDFLPDINIGDYVVVHVGFALQKIDKEEADKQLRVLLEAEEIIKSKLR
jgi:hydrogenase expression/formation protein HypC